MADMPMNPEAASFLTPEQRKVLIQRDLEDQKAQLAAAEATALATGQGAAAGTNQVLPVYNPTAQQQIDAITNAQMPAQPGSETGTVPTAQPQMPVQPEVAFEVAPTKTEALIDQSLSNIDANNRGYNKQVAEIDKLYSSPEYKQRIEKRQERLDQVEEAYTKGLEEIQKVSAEKADPDNYWSQKSTGQKVLAGIGLLFGALGSANDGQNRAASIIQDAIKQDIDLQLKNKDSRLNALQNRQSTYARLLDYYKDPELAKSASMIAGLEKAQTLARAYQAKTNNEQAKNALIGVQANLDEKKLQLQAKMKERIATNIELGKEYSSDEASQKGPKALQNAIQLPNGKLGFVTSPKAADKYREVFQEVQNVKAGVKDLKELITAKSKVPWSDDAARVETLMTALTGALRLPFTGPGTLTDDEKKQIRGAIGDPSKVRSLPSQTKAKLLVIDQWMDRSLMNSAKAGGFSNESSFKSQQDKNQDVIQKKKLKEVE